MSNASDAAEVICKVYSSRQPRPNGRGVDLENYSEFAGDDEGAPVGSMAKLPQLFTLAEVARALAVSPHTVRAFVRSGKLPPVRICRRLLFHPYELTKFINAAK